MPFEVSWLVDKRVVYVRTYGDMTMSEMEERSIESRKLCEVGIPFVYVISDASDLVKVNVKLQDVLSFFRGAKVIETVGWSVFVGATSVERFFFGIISQFNHNKYRTYAKLEDAVAFIQSVDDTLPTIPMPGHVNK